MTNKTFSEFCKLGASKVFNEDYCVTLEDGTTKVVRYTDKGCDYHEDGSVNHRLFTGTIDGEEFTLVTIDTIKARLTGNSNGTRKGNGNKGNGNKKNNKPLNGTELADKINKHVDALQNAYTNFYNLLVSWGVDTDTINFLNFDSEIYRSKISDKCEEENNELKKAQTTTVKEDVKKTLLKTGLTKAELLAMLADMKD